MRGSGLASDNKNKLSLLFTNIRSVSSKRDELSSVIDSCDADVVVLTETWLSAKVGSNEFF